MKFLHGPVAPPGPPASAAAETALVRTEDTDMSTSSYNVQAVVVTPETSLYGRELTQMLKRVAAHIFTTVFEWHERARQRRRLSEIDDRMLEDIGLSRADVSREVEKPFWML
jgi:uncharacterized protein YjiS (DUF1127 family)